MTAEVEACKIAAGVALAEYQTERDQIDHLTDWLALSVRLANALRDLLRALDEDPGPEGPGRLMPGGGWISGSST